MTNDNNILKKWLDKLQEESWNLELLISGFSIFGLFKAREFLEAKRAMFFANDIVTNSLMAWFRPFFEVIYASVFIFIIFLLLHIIFRGLWIGAIGIRYVSGEIDYNKLNYNSTIKNYIQRKTGSFDDYIMKLEKISSIIFGYTFLLILVICSAYFFMLFSGLIVNGLAKLMGDNFAWIHQFVLPIIIMLIAALAVIDFVTAGAIKRIKNRRLIKVYIVSSKIISWITLAFLWRPLYLNLADKKSTKWLIYFAIPIFVVLLLQSTINYNAFSIFPEQFTFDEQRIFTSVSLKEKARYTFQTMYYDNLRQENEVIEVMSLQNHKMEHKSIELFVKLYNYDESLILKMDSSIQTITTKGFNTYLLKKSDYEKELRARSKEAPKLNRAYYKKEQINYRENLEKVLQAAKKIYDIRINNTLIHKDSIDILFHEHPNKTEVGFLLLFSAENLKNGKNLITLEKLYFDRVAEKYDNFDFSIPFIYTDPKD